MSNLKNDGYRFMVSLDGQVGNWIHPLEVATQAPGWHDCTDMDDVAFDLFIADLRAKFPPLAA
jgi:hypothetical protein